MDIYIRRIADGLIKKKNKSEAGVVFFLGAGFSMRKADEVDGLGSGNELASKLCLQLDRPNTLSLERASEYFEAVFDRTDLISEVKSYIKENQTQKKSHMLLSEIINLLDEPNEIVFTTNYDTLLETAYKEKYRKDLEVWKLGESYSKYRHIYKIHGCISLESEMVLTSEDFYNVTTEENLMKDLYSVLRNNTCVFIGFGMEDRDLLDLLFNIRAKNQNFGAMKHYLVIPEGRIDKERVKYLNKKFGIEQIALDRDDFLERLIEEFKKKVAMID